MEKAAETIESMRAVCPYLWTLIISLFAGIVQYAEKLRSGAVFSVKELVCDLLICVFVGYCTMLVCEIAGIVGNAQIFLIAISSHMGTNALMQYEAFRNRVLGLKGVKRGKL